jgi:hypothetical protein
VAGPKKKDGGVQVTVEPIRPAWVSQAHLLRVYKAQGRLAASHQCWQIAKVEACREFLSYNASPQWRWILYTHSLTFMQFVKDVEEELENLQDALAQCNGRYEPGDLIPDHDPVLVRRQDGNDDYALELVVLPRDLVLLSKTENSCMVWANNNFNHISDIPRSIAISMSIEEFVSDAKAAQRVRESDKEVLKTGPSLIREELKVLGKVLKRISFSFALPLEMISEYGSFAAICFDAASALTYPTFKIPRLPRCQSTSEVEPRRNGTLDAEG